MLTPLDIIPIYSPASGKILNIKQSNGNIHISIFLNFWDDHTQYSPINGQVVKQFYTPGSKLPALFSKACNNESMSTYVYNPYIGTVSIRQISGIIFRRIANYVQEGQELKSQQPIGEILFGSRVDVTIKPKPNSDFKLLVNKNDYLKGAKSVIGQYTGEF